MTERITNDLMIAPEEGELGLLRELASALAKSEPVVVSCGHMEMQLPPSARDGLSRVASYLAADSSVAIEPYDEELTTQEAADLLGVSRPYFIRLLEDKKIIPFEKVGVHGKHRRVNLRDVLSYRDGRALDAVQESRELAPSSVEAETTSAY